MIKTAQHPYLIEHNIGWANNQVIEDAQKPSIHFHVGELVRFDGLWTASDGGIWYSKDQLLIKSGRITKVIKVQSIHSLSIMDWAGHPQLCYTIYKKTPHLGCLHKQVMIIERLRLRHDLHDHLF